MHTNKTVYHDKYGTSLDSSLDYLLHKILRPDQIPPRVHRLWVHRKPFNILKSQNKKVPLTAETPLTASLP